MNRGRDAGRTADGRRGRWKRRLLACAAALVTFAAWLGWGRTTDLPHASGIDRLPAPPTVLAAAEVVPSQPDLSIEWLGHAGFLIRWDDLTVVLDPNLNSRCTVAPRRWAVPEQAFDALARQSIDVALISHAHFDHLDLDTLRRIAPNRIVVPQGAARYVAGLDRPVEELEAWQEPLELRGGHKAPAENSSELTVHAVPAAHNGNRLHPFASRAGALGYVLQRGDVSIYFAGDTGRSAPFEEIAERFAPAIALLPIGAYAPRWPLARYHLSPEDAAEVARSLGDPLVIPMHFGTFRLSLDAPRSALPRFAAAARKLDVRWALAPPVEYLTSQGPQDEA